MCFPLVAEDMLSMAIGALGGVIVPVYDPALVDSPSKTETPAYTSPLKGSWVGEGSGARRRLSDHGFDNTREKI